MKCELEEIKGDGFKPFAVKISLDSFSEALFLYFVFTYGPLAGILNGEDSVKVRNVIKTGLREQGLSVTSDDYESLKSLLLRRS